jgi:DNA-binding CsgD family transcriptional regulator
MVDERAVFDFPGRTAAILRRVNWSRTSLGKPSSWPGSLKNSIRLVLNSRHPTLVLWGDELIQFYNDSFAPIARAYCSTRGLGRPAKTYWHGLWPEMGTDIQDVMSGQGGILRRRQAFEHADGNASTAYLWYFSITPIFDDDQIGGVLLLCQEEAAADNAWSKTNLREAELVRVQQIGRFGGLEVVLSSGFQNRRSPEYLLLHGLPPEASNESHEDWVRRIHPDDRYRTERAFIDAVAGESKGYSIQYRIIRPSDGKIRWISAKTEIERRSSGDAIRLIGAHADVTDQIDIGVFQRAQFTAALDMLRCAVLLVCSDGNINYANLTATQMLTEGTFIRSRSSKISAVLNSARATLTEVLRSMGRATVVSASCVKLSDTLPIVAHVVPLASIELHNRIAPAVAAIFIREQDDSRSSAALLASTYELTLAEARVLSHLLRGHTLAEAAEKLRVANSTVRTQLDVIFRKTGVNRQSELLLLSAQLLPPIRE